MANIWKQNKDVGNHPNRNNFDLSNFVHSTFKMGYLYPVFKRAVVPGDSFRIDSAFDLKLMPLSFPVQSRMRAHMHFFYVRNKNLWSGWQDWIEGLRSNTETPHPYVLPYDSDVKTGSIYDFLGVPTSIVTHANLTRTYSVLQSKWDSLCYRKNSFNVGDKFSDFISEQYSTTFANRTVSIADPFSPCSTLTFSPTSYASFIGINEALTVYCVVGFGDNFWDAVYAQTVSDVVWNPITFKISFGSTGQSDLSTLAAAHPHEKMFVSFFFNKSGAVQRFTTYSPSLVSNLVAPAGFYDYSTLGLDYYKNHQPLNALPFRAYESVYYAFYASDVLQPLVIDGRKEYNKFNSTTAAGRDYTDYHLFRRNYELDFLTSALPSPQSGNAPLVGLTAFNSVGDITITDENGITTAKVAFSGDSTDLVITSPQASVDHGRTLLNMALSGMNINDFRATNAFQHFLEQTLRSGYRYANFIKGHFGKEPEYRELDMPEFIGGYSRDVTVNTVVSQADTLGIDGSGSGTDLGEFVGNGRLVGGSSHSISHYCDDYGYIIGIMCITPQPAYSQLLSKDMICPTNNLDYYFEEFSQLGLQPISYREVAPLQAYLDSLADNTKSVDDVFGYQRPYYDMVGSVDEVHGEFRGSMRNWLVNRIFDGRPELGSKFLEIDPEEVNDIFANVNPSDDTIIGHLAFKVFAKRPVPRVHLPGLGR